MPMNTSTAVVVCRDNSGRLIIPDDFVGSTANTIVVNFAAPMSGYCEVWMGEPVRYCEVWMGEPVRFGRIAMYLGFLLAAILVGLALWRLFARLRGLAER